MTGEPKANAEAEATVKAGTQANCAGIATVRVRLRRTFDDSPVACEIGPFEGIRENDVQPTDEYFQTCAGAASRGVQKAFVERGLTVGIRATIPYLLVHPVDASAPLFEQAAYDATNQALVTLYPSGIE